MVSCELWSNLECSLFLQNLFIRILVPFLTFWKHLWACLFYHLLEMEESELSRSSCWMDKTCLWQLTCSLVSVSTLLVTVSLLEPQLRIDNTFCFLLIYTWKIFWFQNSVEQVQCFSMFLSKYLMIWQTKVGTIGQNIYGYHGLGLEHLNRFVMLRCWNKWSISSILFIKH